MSAATENDLTPEMIDAALRVDWVEKYQGEFLDFEEASYATMRERIAKLWCAMMAARVLRSER